VKVRETPDKTVIKLMEGAEEKNISGLLSDSNTGVWEVNIY
jgi:hypothetical protein